MYGNIKSIMNLLFHFLSVHLAALKKNAIKLARSASRRGSSRRGKQMTGYLLFLLPLGDKNVF